MTAGAARLAGLGAGVALVVALVASADSTGAEPVTFSNEIVRVFALLAHDLRRRRTPSVRRSAASPTRGRCPPGSRCRASATSSTRAVGWGEGTTDEMCIAFLRVTVDAERLGAR